MSIMLHITYNYALQTIQALSCQGYTHSMSPPTMACSAARLFSISVSRGYCPGSTINTFNHLPHPFSGLIIVQHLYFHCYNHGSRTFPFVGTSYQCQKAFFCLWLIPGSRQHSTSKSKVKLKKLFGIETLMLGGGGVLNWSFIQAGMCDEVSVVIAPVADGSSKTPALFNAKDEWASDTPVAFELQSAEIKDGGSVWLRYLVKR